MMLYGVQAAVNAIPVGALDAVRFDNRTTAAGITKTTATTDSALLTVSLWFKVANDDNSQHSLVQLWDFNSYLFVNSFAVHDVMIALTGTSSRYLQFGSAGGAFSSDVWNHIFMSADANHAAGTKLKTLMLNGTDVIYAANTQDVDAAFTIFLNAKNFGIPAASGNLGPGSQGNSLISFAHVWINRGVYMTTSDVTKFRTVGGAPADLGANGQTPTGSSPLYYFKGNSSTFASNLGTGGNPTLVGSMQDAIGP